MKVYTILFIPTNEIIGVAASLTQASAMAENIWNVSHSKILLPDKFDLRQFEILPFTVGRSIGHL